MTEAEKKAKKKYIAKGKRLTIDFYPPDAELIEHIEKQPKKQSYIKDLIRKDMLIIKKAKTVELTEEEQIELFVLTSCVEKDRAEAFIERYKREIYEKRQMEKEGKSETI